MRKCRPIGDGISVRIHFTNKRVKIQDIGISILQRICSLSFTIQENRHEVVNGV